MTRTSGAPAHTIGRRLGLLGLLLCGVAALAGCTGGGSAQPSATTAPAQPQVGRFASDNPGSVNTYWLPTPQGLILVDTLRTLTDARHALAEIQRTGKPVVGILITHSHPDHVGGAGVFHAAYPNAPIYASEATLTVMRSDPRGFYPLTRSVPNADYPDQLTYPDRTFTPGTPLEIGGVRLETAEFAGAESDTATTYYQPASGQLFSGDLTGNRVTPALLEGHTCGWLTDLDQLHTRFPDARTMYPGHGAPGTPNDLINQQREYLQHFRRLVRAAVAPNSPAGTATSPDEEKSITDEMNRSYSGYPRVASIPTLVEENVKAVSRELLAEDATKTPPACR